MSGFTIAGLGALLTAWMTGWLFPSFRGHMVSHMMVVAVAAPLLAFGVEGTRFDPVRYAPGLMSPLPMSVIEFFVVWLWHLPVLHEGARMNWTWAVAEQGSFLLSGFLFSISILGGTFSERPQRRAAGVVALLLTAMHMTLLGAILALSPRSLYQHAHVHDGFPPLRDQHWGGVIMLIWGAIAYSGFGIWLVSRLLRGQS